MLVVNAYLMLAVIPIIYRQCKGTTKFELHKEKERFFQLPLLLYSFFIPSLFLLYCHLIPDSRAPVYFFGTKVSQVWSS